LIKATNKHEIIVKAKHLGSVWTKENKIERKLEGKKFGKLVFFLLFRLEKKYKEKKSF